MHNLSFRTWRGILLRLFLSGWENNSSFVGNIFRVHNLSRYQSDFQSQKKWRVRIRAERFPNPPKMEGFKPYGMPMCKIEPVILKLEEYESIRLVNYDKLPQDQAAIRMNVSRPTFTRIYNNALNSTLTDLVF